MAEITIGSRVIHAYRRGLGPGTVLRHSQAGGFIVQWDDPKSIMHPSHNGKSQAAQENLELVAEEKPDA